MTEDPNKLLAEARSLGQGLDWWSADFDTRKALVCSLCSALAYFHLPEYELAHAGRIKVVPCTWWQELATIGTARDIRAALAPSETPVFVVESDGAIVVGMKLRDLTIVAFRGTKQLYDWRFDLDARRQHVHRDEMIFRFHRGFLNAVAPSFRELRDQLEEPFCRGDPIYVTGHSLGGAMAAIVMADWGGIRYRFVDNQRRTIVRFAIDGCYTFGMPRYGDRATFRHLNTPHAVKNSGDPIPNLPPKWMGYGDCKPALVLPSNNLRTSHHLLPRAVTSIQHHFMEQYLRGVRTAAHSGRQPTQESFVVF